MTVPSSGELAVCQQPTRQQFRATLLLPRTTGRVELRGAGDLTSPSAWRTARAAAPRPDPRRRRCGLSGLVGSRGRAARSRDRPGIAWVTDRASSRTSAWRMPRGLSAGTSRLGRCSARARRCASASSKFRRRAAGSADGAAGSSKRLRRCSNGKSYERDRPGCIAQRDWLRGMPGGRVAGLVASPAPLRGLRAHRLLR